MLVVSLWGAKPFEPKQDNNNQSGLRGFMEERPCVNARGQELSPWAGEFSESDLDPTCLKKKWLEMGGRDLDSWFDVHILKKI